MTLTKNASVLCDLRYFQPGETWPKLARRIASTVASAEKTPELQKKWEEEFYSGIVTGEFVPATPFLMNAGLTNTLFSCFVLPVDDSLRSIMETAGNAAKIFQGAGGVGYSFSSLRPAGSPVASNSKGEASGPVSFMKIYNTTCSVLKQGGSRKGAQMGVLDISHPDIEEFINVKQDLTQLTNFNISVNITDAFMTAVENDDDWVLHFDRVTKTKVVSARALWNQIVHNAWKTGDPGLLFLERANEVDPIGGIVATNPCSEQPLPPYACCNLGSIDVSKLIKNGEFDTARYEWLIRVFIRFLDDAIEINKYSLKEIEERQKAERRVGLGVMGVADALIKLGLPYDSERGRGWCESISSELKSAAWQASADLAKEKGAFPWFKKSKLNGPTPFRNATCTTIAPTGSISIVAGCSSGIEPIYALAFTRRHELKGSEELTEVNQTFFEVAKAKGFYSDRLLKRIIENKGSCQGLQEVPKDVQDVFKTAIDIAPRDHINMLISWQKYIDTGVSKTINLPSTATEKDVEEAYLQAYRGKCKGVTVFRDGCRGTQVLSTGPTEVKGRPDAIKGVTYKVETALGTMFTTINEVEEGKPFEVFAVLSKGGSNAAADSEAIGRLVSLALRGGISVEKIVSQIKGIGGGSAAFNKGRVITSIPDAVAYVLEKAYLNEKVEHPDDTAKYFPSGTEQMPYCKDCD
jgi:ribonucleoside-diphosphate reductase alpha chain